MNERSGENFEQFVREQIKQSEPLGSGEEKEVYLLEQKNGRKETMGVFKESVSESKNLIKARYYLTNILNILMPDNFSHIKMVTSEPNTVWSDYKVSKRGVPNWEIYNFADWIQMHYGTHIDDGDLDNYRYANGKQLYIDTIIPFGLDKKGEFVGNYNVVALRREIEKMNDTLLATKARKYLERLEILFENDFQDYQQ